MTDQTPIPATDEQVRAHARAVVSGHEPPNRDCGLCQRAVEILAWNELGIIDPFDPETRPDPTARPVRVHCDQCGVIGVFYSSNGGVDVMPKTEEHVANHHWPTFTHEWLDVNQPAPVHDDLPTS